MKNFGKNGNAETLEKLLVYDAIIKTKLMYGLESLQLDKEQRGRLDTFQLKGIRQILKIPTTFGQMKRGQKPTWNNDRTFNLVNAKINTVENRLKAGGFFRKYKKVIPLSEYYYSIKRKAIIEIINQENDNPMKFATTDETLKLKEYGFKGWGGVRHNWWIKGLEE